MVSMLIFYLKVYNKLEKLPERYSEEESIYLRYMLARYQAYPNLIWNYSKEGYFEADKDYFYHNAKKIRCMDAYRHLCTIHDDLVYALDPEYGKTVDFLVLQQFGEYASSCMYYRERSKKPVVLGEFAQDYSCTWEQINCPKHRLIYLKPSIILLLMTNRRRI